MSTAVIRNRKTDAACVFIDLATHGAFLPVFEFPEHPLPGLSRRSQNVSLLYVAGVLS